MSKETNIDYAEQTYKRNKVSTFKKNTKTHFTFSMFFGLHKREEVEIIHDQSYYIKNHLPSLASKQLVFFYEIHIQQISGPTTTSQLNE